MFHRVSRVFLCPCCRCNLITDMGIGYLSTMASLRKLFLRYCQQVHDLGLHHIYSMRKLTHLSLAGNARPWPILSYISFQFIDTLFVCLL